MIQVRPLVHQVFSAPVVPSGPDYESWDGSWYDFSDAASINANGSNQIISVANKHAGQGDLIGAGNIANRTRVAAAINGRDIFRLVRDVSSSANIVRLSATDTDPVSQLFQGNDVPYVSLSVFQVKDANTRFIYSPSDTTNGTTSESIAFVSRNAGNCSLRRRTDVLGAVGAQTDWGTGHPNGSLRFVAIRMNGTTVDIWDNSHTKAIAAGAHNANAFSTGISLHIGADEIGGADPTFPLTQGNTDYCEFLFTTAKLDTEIDQALDDLAIKWTGAPL